jgi:hypothetical protein
MGYGQDGRGSILNRERFFLLHNVQISSEAHPASYPGVLGPLSPWVKRPVREAVHSPSSAEVKNGGAVPTLLNVPSWHIA